MELIYQTLFPSEGRKLTDICFDKIKNSIGEKFN